MHQALHLIAVVCSIGTRTLAEHIHPMETPDDSEIIEGDMIMTKDQIKAIRAPQRGRNLDSDEISDSETKYSELWHNATVPYIILKSAEPFENDIKTAMKTWEENTCLKFVQITPKEAKEQQLFNYITFLATKPTICSSHVGMQQSPQRISVGEGCTAFKQIGHEIGHAIGFLHEQSRLDRGKFIRVYKKNTQDDFYADNIQREPNFLHNYHFPYDFSSLMHYEMHMFSKNGNNTMVPSDEHVRETVNVGGDRLSFYDRKHANLLYKCDAKCNSKPVCHHEGFKDQFCKCNCKEGYSGDYCEKEVLVPGPTCGGNFTSEEEIESPNYPDPTPKGIKCIWEFQAPRGKLVRVHFQDFELSNKSIVHKTCWGDTLDIRGGGYDGQLTYCAKDLDGKVLTMDNTRNKTYILFKASSNVRYQPGKFKADVKFV